MQIICHSFHSLPIPSVLTVSLRECVCCPLEGVQSEASQAVSVSLFTLAAGFVWVFCGGPKKSSVRSAPRGKHAQLAFLSSLSPSLSLTLSVCSHRTPRWVSGNFLCPAKICFAFVLIYFIAKCIFGFSFDFDFDLWVFSWGFFLRWFCWPQKTEAKANWSESVALTFGPSEMKTNLI